MALDGFRRWLMAGMAGLAAVVALGLAGCDGAANSSRPSFKAVDITGADYARELEMNDADGRRRSLAEFKGKVVVIFFGFTQCPDVCPTTLIELAQVKKLLGADGARVQGIFVTVDPERDTPELLKAYVSNFGADFIGLRGTDDELKGAARHFKVLYSKVPGKSEGNYTMEHTAASFVFDPQGRIRLYTRYGSGADALAHDIRTLLNEGR